MQSNKIVIHFTDGSVLKGTTSDFFPNKQSFHLNHPDGQIEEIDFDKLKALFFVKDTEGKKDHVDKYDDVVAGGGRKIAVEFPDGETIIGYVLGYSPQRPGFMMTSADLGGNNERIYVVNSAVKNVQFL